MREKPEGQWFGEEEWFMFQSNPICRHVCYVGFMVGGWMMLGVIGGPVFGASIPIITKLVLRCSTAEPPKAHIHHLTPARDNGVVDNPSSCGVVGLDGAFGLGPTHVDKGLPVGNHLLCLGIPIRKCHSGFFFIKKVLKN